MSNALVTSRSLDSDPRWREMVKRYAVDIVRFAIEVVGIQPSQQQIVFFTEVQKPGSRVSVSSGHGCGKTAALSIIALHHLTMFFQSNCLITANDLDQLKSTFHKELAVNAERIGRGYYAWLADYIEILSNGTARVRGFESTWFLESKTSNNTRQANKFAGRHNRFHLVIVDEASSVENVICETLAGSLTERYNRMILTSQMTRNSGYFWQTQFEWMKPAGDWVPLVFSSFQSPFVDKEALKRMWFEYESDERLVRLLGEPPVDSNKLFMSLMDANRMYSHGQIIRDDEDYGYMACSDIASGEGERDKSAVVIAKVIGRGNFGPDARRVEIIKIPLLTNKIRSNTFANYIAEEMAEYSNCTAIVDAGGLGVNVCQDLEEIGKQTHRVLWGNPCFQRMNKDRYLNLRAQATHHAARAAKEGRLSIRTPDHKRVMVRQASNIPRTYTDRYRLKVPPKGSKEWGGLSSPDLWDSITFSFLENAHYVPANKSGFGHVSPERSVLDIANDYFAGVM